VLLIFNTAAWCGRCAADMPDLIELHEDLGEQGLTVMVSLFQDRDHELPEGRDAGQYQRQHDLPFLVVADPTQLMLGYFEEVGLPMVLVADLETMEILHADLGWNLSAMRQLAEAHL
jgi:thiol-disulfide isomerase/thioredoxin